MIGYIPRYPSLSLLLLFYIKSRRLLVIQGKVAKEVGKNHLRTLNKYVHV